MKLGRGGSSQELPLFRSIVHTKLGEQLRKKGAISYTRVRELVLQKLATLGLNSNSSAFIASGPVVPRRCWCPGLFVQMPSSLA